LDARIEIIDEQLYTNGMAQILKEEYRERILNASLAEFFNYGYEDASMRRIAVEAKMSVGNLYHYYPNKEKLFNALVQDTIQAFNTIILKQGKLEINEIERNAWFKDQVKQLTQGLVEVYSKHQTETLILLRYSKLNDQIAQSIKHMIDGIILQWFPAIEARNKQVETLCIMLADAIFAGLSRLFEDAYQSKFEIDIDWTLETYLNLFTLMIEAGDTMYEAK
jgi:AcrR family transcriptional regulator